MSAGERLMHTGRQLGSENLCTVFREFQLMLYIVDQDDYSTPSKMVAKLGAVAVEGVRPTQNFLKNISDPRFSVLAFDPS